MPDPSGSSDNRTILVIDEDPQVGRLIRLTLSGPNSKVLVSSRIEDGLRQAARQKPSLIVMESRFKTADGIVLAGKLLQAPATSRSAVAIFTADTTLYRRIQAQQLGVIDYLLKPLSGQLLHDRLAAIFAQLADAPRPPRCGPQAKRLLARVRQIEEGKLSSGIWLMSGSQRAELIFEAGGLVSARLDRQEGLEAVDLIARHGDWEFSTDEPDLEDTLQPEAGFSPDGFYDDDDEHTILDPRPPLMDFNSVTPLIDRPLDDISTMPKTVPEVSCPVPEKRRAPAKSAEQRSSSFDARATDRAINPASKPAAGHGPLGKSPTIPPAPEVSHGEITQWLSEVKHPPVIVALQNSQVCRDLEAKAKARGFTVVTVDNALKAYEATRAQRAAAVVADTILPDATGQDLLSAVRSDFLVRETPFIIIASADLAPRMTGNGAVLEPILQGLDRALSPRVRLWTQLSHVGSAEGWVEQVGVAYLLRILGAAKFSGHMQLRYGDQREAEAVFNRGKICGVTVAAPQPSVGPLAMLHLVGYEWTNYLISPEDAGLKVPLGELETLVEVACRQNNTLLQRAFKEGLNIEEVSVERSSLDAYLRTLPASSLSLLLQLVEGESGESIARNGVSPSLLKALLHDMRRKGVIRVGSLKPVRSDKDQRWASLASANDRPKRRAGRWLVVLLTTLLTVAMASGGYFLYHHLKTPTIATIPQKVDDAGDKAASPTPPSSADANDARIED